MSGVWTEDVLAVAEPLVRAGESYSHVAGVLSERFGVDITRSAVIGKSARMGWVQAKKEKPAIGANVTPARRAKKMPSAAPAAAAVAPPAAPQPVPPLPLAAPAPAAAPVRASGFGPGVPLMSTKGEQCRYIISETSDRGAICCGSRTIPGMSWCSRHARRVFEPRQRGVSQPKARVAP